MSEPSLPTKDMILRLPRWAVVAFAARCARRVEPLTHGLGAKGSKAIEHVILKAEATASISNDHRAARMAYASFDAAGAYPAADYVAADYAVRRAADAAAEAAWTAEYAAISAHDDARGITAATNAITKAARAEVKRFTDDAAGNGDVAAYCAAKAARAAHDAARAAAKVDCSLKAIVSDFQILESAARIGSWTNDTQVAPDVFGPLWPEGAPPWA
ncbi:MAG: hypothetical protein IT581_14380 [Verrucomicrobiales bacterium]|nr:hypothetical protein [Verrucomicrobiales bacterium]